MRARVTWATALAVACASACAQEPGTGPVADVVDRSDLPGFWANPIPVSTCSCPSGTQCNAYDECVADPAAKPPRGPQWAGVAGGGARRGRSAFAGPSAASVAWQVERACCFLDSPAIGEDGTVYVSWFDQATFPVTADSNALVAVSPDGSEKWSWSPEIREDMGPAAISGPELGADGTIYVTYGRTLQAIEPRDGTTRFAVNLGFAPPGVSGPTVSPDGRITVHNRDGQVVSFRPDGTVAWRANIGSGAFWIGAAGDDDVLYVSRAKTGPADVDRLVAMGPGGGIGWTVSGVGGRVPVAAPGGGLVVGAGEAIVSLRRDRSTAWQATGLVERHAALVGPGGSAYVATTGEQGDSVKSIGADGFVRWTSPLGRERGPRLGAVDANGHVYATTSDGHVLAVSPGGQVTWELALDARSLGAPIVGDGAVYVLDGGVAKSRLLKLAAP